MGPILLMACPNSTTPCRSRRDTPTKPTSAARWTTVAIAAVALLLTLNGVRWLLQESPAAANELLVATCLLDSVSGELDSPRVCTEVRTNDR